MCCNDWFVFFLNSSTADETFVLQYVTARVFKEIMRDYCQGVAMLRAGTEAALERAAGVHAPRTVQQAGTRFQSSR